MESIKSFKSTGPMVGLRLKDLTLRYDSMHMQVLVADSEAAAFYEKCGFTRAGKTESMWIYEGRDH